MKDNFYIFAGSVWATLVAFIVIYLLDPSSIRYLYLTIPLFIFVLYFSSLKGYMRNLQNKKKVVLEDSILIGLFLLYCLVIFSISEESFRENFILYFLPFLVGGAILSLYRRNQSHPQGGETE